MVQYPRENRYKTLGLWSLSLSYNIKTGMTTGIFDGVSVEEWNELVPQLLSAPKHHVTHPLYLLTAVLDFGADYTAEDRKSLDDELYQLEFSTGFRREFGESFPYPAKENMDRGKLMYDSQHITASLTYLERRLDFDIRMAEFLMENIGGCDRINSRIKPHSTEYLREIINNQLISSKDQQHQCLMLQKRAQTQISVVSEPVSRVE